MLYYIRVELIKNMQDNLIKKTLKALKNQPGY